MRMLILLIVLLAPAAAVAQTAVHPTTSPVIDADERHAVAFLLHAAHELPPRAEFERAAKDPTVVLRSIAAGNGPIAERAMEALFMWPTDQTFAIGAVQLADPATKSGRRHRLLLLMSETFGARATPVVVKFLQDDDARLRITAAAAVAKIRNDEAFAALDAAIAAETNEIVAREMLRYARRVR